MNIYARYFNQETLVHNMDELIAFLSSIPGIQINDELIDDISKYAESNITYPKRYKIRPRVYFILIKTSAETIEEFKSNQHSLITQNNSRNDANSKDMRANALSVKKEGWYKGSLTFKRVIPIPETGKFQYQDTTFTALTKSCSGQECYENIISHLKSREDIDPRSQFPSAKGNNFKFSFVSALNDNESKDYSENEYVDDYLADE